MVNQVQLGKSSVNVFPIALGTNAVGGHNLYPNLDEEQGKEVVRQAIDNGITLLDTAYIYGPERSKISWTSCKRISTKCKLQQKVHMLLKKMEKLFKITIQNF